jgi:hypothetical protein
MRNQFGRTLPPLIAMSQPWMILSLPVLIKPTVCSEKCGHKQNGAPK